MTSNQRAQSSINPFAKNKSYRDIIVTSNFFTSRIQYYIVFEEEKKLRNIAKLYY